MIIDKINLQNNTLEMLKEGLTIYLLSVKGRHFEVKMTQDLKLKREEKNNG